MTLSTDPIDLLVNTVTGDVVFPLTFSKGLAGVVQSARVALAMVAGEWFLDLDAGVRYFERDGVAAADALFGQKYDQAKAIGEFRRVLTQVAGIVTINSLAVTFVGATRAMTVTWSASTVFGDTPPDTLALGA